jgi:hypothetical protein
VTKSERTWDHLAEDTVEDIHRGRLNQESGYWSVSGVGNQESPREEGCLTPCHMTVGNVHASCKAKARRWKTLTLLKGRFVPKVLRPLSRFFIIIGCSTATIFLGGISKVGADDLLAIVI